jgi:hypothetical protein
MNAHSVYHESFAVDWSTVTVRWSKPDMRKVREVVTGFAIGLVFFALSFAFCVQAARADGACEIEQSRRGAAVMNLADSTRTWVPATSSEKGISVYLSPDAGDIITWGILCEYSKIKTTIFVFRGMSSAYSSADLMARVSMLILISRQDELLRTVRQCVAAVGREEFSHSTLEHYSVDCAKETEAGKTFLRVMISKR